MSDLTRRSALTGAAVVLAGGVAGFVVARNSDAAEEESTGAANAYAPAPPKAPSSSAGGTAPAPTPLADVAAVPAGGGIILKHPSVVLTKEASGTVHAFTTTCPHAGCVVYRVKDGTIDCPCHGSKFSVTTGDVVAGPAPHGLTSIPVTVSGGKIFPA